MAPEKKTPAPTEASLPLISPTLAAVPTLVEPATPAQHAVAGDPTRETSLTERVETVTPWPLVLPMAVLTATRACPATPLMAGTLILVTSGGPLTILEIRVVSSQSETRPIQVDAVLPHTLEPGTATWLWRSTVPADDAPFAPAALLVRVAELPGTDAANAAAAAGTTGWLLATFAPLEDRCIAPAAAPEQTLTPRSTGASTDTNDEAPPAPPRRRRPSRSSSRP